MARARNIKPGFFKNELLAEMPPEIRLLFMGLWCIADREGRFEERPKKIKMELFPCDSFSIEDGLARLAQDGFLIRYEVEGKRYAQVVNFTKHQMPHHKEVQSEIPAPPGFAQITKHAYDAPKETREAVLSFWQSIRENDRLLFDEPSRKVAVYANERSQVVLAIQDRENTCISQISGDEIEDLDRMFALAFREAAETSAWNETLAVTSRAKSSATKKRAA